MTAPTVAQFAAVVNEVLSDEAIARWRRNLIKEYTWLYGAAHEPIKRERGRTSGGDVSDPTANMVIGAVPSKPDAERDAHKAPQAVLRMTCEKATRSVLQIDNDLYGLYRMLRRWEGRRDGRGILDPPENLQDELKVGRDKGKRKVGPEELERLKSFQRQRFERGEGIA